MRLRAEQLDAHLAKSLASIYTIHGDEPLLALEAADAVRAAARRSGCTEREVLFAERGFDWSAFTHAGASRSLFGGARIVELRLPSGRPGAEGAAAIEHYCAKRGAEGVTLVSLPRLDRTGQTSGWFGALEASGVIVEVWPLERARLAQWIGARLARSGQHAASAVLEFLADRVEGNLLAAHQEVQKLALLLPAGELSLAQVEQAVTNVARYDAHDGSEALLAGDLARYLRILEGLRGEGEPPSYALWTLSEDLRALLEIRSALAAGGSIDPVLRARRVRASRHALMKAAARRHSREALRRALARAARIDRVIKGVARGEPWGEFARLGLELLHGTEGGRGQR